MKRKIRKIRQIRLQKFRKQKERNKYDNKWWAKVLIEMFDNHPYWITASLPYYAFIYVDMHYGWEFGHPVKLIFLYDRMSQDIKYGLFWAKFSDASDDYSYKTYFKELGSRHLDNMVFIDDMIHFEAKNIQSHWDVGYYEIIIKSGPQGCYLSIQSLEMDKYEPYKWLLDLFDDVVNSIPEDFYDNIDNWEEVRNKREIIDEEGIQNIRL
jgi:hypothetical protein